MAPDVSVVIPTFNRWPMLAETVASVLAQREADFELIIVDDGSTDETAARLPELITALDGTHRLVRILRTANHGVAAARNLGVRAACAPLIAFLDSDDLWKTDKLKYQIAQMRKDSGCAISQTGEVWMRHGVLVNPGRRHLKRSGDLFFDSLRTCLISASAVIMRTSMFRELGGFDEDLTAAEDYDLWLRVSLEHSVELSPKALVIRRAGHGGQLSQTVPAIDRFRILALLKLLRNSALGPHREVVCNALIEKCHIYSKGASRRGCATEAHFVAHLAEMAIEQFTDDSLECAIDGMRAILARLRVITFDSGNANYELGRA